MAYIVDPPSFDEGTGQYIGDFKVQHRDLSRNQLAVEEPAAVDPSEYNDALDPYLAQQAAQHNLPIFDENASDESIVSFWRSNRPLTDSEVSAIQAAYAATDNNEIANLLQWKLTGDTSVLSEQQLWELGLSEDDQSSEPEADTTPEQDFSDDQLAEIEGWLIDNATDPNPEAAQAILEANIGDSDEASAVQYIAYQYYQGELTLEDAYNEALDTGLPEAKLYAAFQNLYNQTLK